MDFLSNPNLSFSALGHTLLLIKNLNYNDYMGINYKTSQNFGLLVKQKNNFNKININYSNLHFYNQTFMSVRSSLRSNSE